jgi:hypothetical protein
VWGEVLGDEVIAAAFIDRILHHCHIVNIRGNSYRMRQHTELWQAFHQGAADPIILRGIIYIDHSIHYCPGSFLITEPLLRLAS